MGTWYSLLCLLPLKNKNPVQILWWAFEINARHSSCYCSVIVRANQC